MSVDRHLFAGHSVAAVVALVQTHLSIRHLLLAIPYIFESDKRNKEMNIKFIVLDALRERKRTGSEQTKRTARRKSLFILRWRGGEREGGGV